MTLKALYQKNTQECGFIQDAYQLQALSLLQKLSDALLAQAPQKPSSLWHRLFKVSALQVAVPGLYFWGGVGTGKTYLMDLFYQHLAIEKKMRLHFHHFMQRVHQELAKLEGAENPLHLVASTFAGKARVICIDEFYVSDITDAMLLSSLLEQLFLQGVTLVFTSNSSPDTLYKNGLQRARFLPAIALIKAHTEVFHLDTKIDYRMRALKDAAIYHYPLNEKTKQKLQAHFALLAGFPRFAKREIIINQRKIISMQDASDLAQFDFAVLCQSARSQLDYIEMAKRYHTIILANVPQMHEEMDDALRRFIALVDECSERKVKFIISAEVPAKQLYLKGRLSFEFQRCLSRLTEMQSGEYLALAHLP